MTTQTIGCSACGAVVPYGRLSCPECGELLASVAGARRRGRATSRSATAATAATAAASAPTDREARGRAADPDAEPIGGAPETDERGPVAGELDAADRDAGEVVDPRWVDDDPVDGDDGSDPDSIAPRTTTTHGLDGPTTWAVGAGLTGSVTPAYMPRPASRAVNPPDAAGATFAPTPAGTPPLPAPMPAPGAYVPPPPVVIPAGPPAPARAWAGQGGTQPAAVDSGVPGTSTVGAGSAAPAATRRASVDGARLTEFAGWLSVAGAAFAAVGFLLPWARVVIGATGLSSYVDRWGLAGQNHVLVVLGVLILLVLGLVGNPIPVWIRTGIGGLGLGPLLLGLVWPYLFVGALGGGPGIAIVAVGAVALIVAGVLALVADRHGGTAPGV
jgi:hypothetical protein